MGYYSTDDHNSDDRASCFGFILIVFTVVFWTGLALGWWAR